MTENPWQVHTIVVLYIATILSALCAIGSYKIFSRWQRSLAARAKMFGYTMLALSLGIPSVYVRVAESASLSDRQFISLVAIILIAVALLALLIAHIDLYYNLNDRRWNSFWKNLLKWQH